jgi:hypothetical protein
MKKLILCPIVLILAIVFSVNAQNYKQLETLADDLKDQAEELAKQTSKDIEKNSAVTAIGIERAFLAEQLFASTRLINQMVEDKHNREDLQTASRILLNMSSRFPEKGANMTEWNRVKSAITALDKEIQQPVNNNIPDQEPVDINNIRGKVFWTGQVDAKVHLVIQGSSIKTRTMSGATYPDGIPSFTAPLPNQGRVTIGVNKKDGRGTVKIIQQPNRRNNYTAIVEIFDGGGGARSYTVEIFW